MADQKVNIKVTTQGATKAKQELGGLSGSINKWGKLLELLLLLTLVLEV